MPDGTSRVLVGGHEQGAAPVARGGKKPLSGKAITDVELLSLSGSVGVNGCHLHLTVAGPDGAVMGGHVGEGCIVRTTAEILLVLLPDWHFSRELDVATGWAELVIRADSA